MTLKLKEKSTTECAMYVICLQEPEHVIAEKIAQGQGIVILILKVLIVITNHVLNSLIVKLTLDAIRFVLKASSYCYQ